MGRNQSHRRVKLRREKKQKSTFADLDLQSMWICSTKKIIKTLILDRQENSHKSKLVPIICRVNRKHTLKFSDVKQRLLWTGARLKPTVASSEIKACGSFLGSTVAK